MLAQSKISSIPNGIEVCQTKKCSKCGHNKPLSEFSKDKYRIDGLNVQCRVCCQEKWHKYASKAHGEKHFDENKDCSQYLGVHVAERILSKLFKDVHRMPLHNPGYDFICSKGYKIDVKSATRVKRYTGWKQWQFDINRNEIADYFLCLAFDNREALNPVHLWLIPGTEINHFKTASIGEKSLSKWAKYERPLDEVISCCNTLKAEA